MPSGYLSPCTWGTRDTFALQMPTTAPQQDTTATRESFYRSRPQKRTFESIVDRVVDHLNEDGEPPRYLPLRRALPPLRQAPVPHPGATDEPEPESWEDIWRRLPESVHPTGSDEFKEMKKNRHTRKRQQVENLVSHVARIIQPNDTVVEFCAGSGYVSLPLAALFPDCTFVLIDLKLKSLEIAQERAQAAGLSNVRIVHDRIENYFANHQLDFQIGISLHACGVATDLSLSFCVNNGASYVMCPCCIGKLKFQIPGLSYPRSARVSQLVELGEYLTVATAADYSYQTLKNLDNHSRARNLKYRCSKTLIEWDRNKYAQEHGFQCALFLLSPRSASPKNDVVVGISQERHAKHGVYWDQGGELDDYMDATQPEWIV